MKNIILKQLYPLLADIGDMSANGVWTKEIKGAAEYYEKLKAALTQEQFELFEKFEICLQKVHSEESEQLYTNTLKLGIRLGMECMVD